MSILDYFKNTQKNTNSSNQINLENININEIYIYTDGSCINNGKKNAQAGIGVYCVDFEISEKLQGLQTNQRAELFAILKALLTVNILKYNKITIYTDSLYSINCITKWIKNWKKNGWLDKNKKPVKNKDLIENIDRILIKYTHINFIHIFSHTNLQDIHSINNDKADILAKKATET